MSETEWIQEFSDTLQYYMKEHNMTQRELADKAGISESLISEYKRGMHIPTVKIVINLAYALNIEVSDLIDFGYRII